MKKNIKKYFSYITVLFALIIGLLIYYFFYKKKDKQRGLDVNSDVKDPVVKNAISIIDSAFNSIGTFDKDLQPIFQTLSLMSGAQIIKLHQLFGNRDYNSLTGKYKIVNTGTYKGFTSSLNLSALYIKEFDKKQIKTLRDIYFDKGLAYPFVI